MVAVLLVAGCVGTPPAATSSATPPSRTSPAPSSSPSVAEATAIAAPSSVPAATAAPPDCVARTLASLTEAQRIGQLFMIGLIDDRLDASERAGISRYHFGSVAFTAQTAEGVAAVRTVTGAVQAQATQAATGGVGFLVAANQEGGRIQGLSGPGFSAMPSALAQGALAPWTLEALAARWGRQLRAAGVNLDLAPVADVVPPGSDAQNAPIGQLEREFGHDPASVASHVAAFVAGMRAAGIATTVKHFPGLGRVAGNTDVTAVVEDDVTVRDDGFLRPFASAIEAGVPFAMVSLATYDRIDPARPAAFSPAVIGGMLRGDLAFRGVVVSDALGATAVASVPPATRALEFLDAGGDLIISNQLTPAIAMAAAIASRAAADPAFRARVDDAARRVLGAKEVLGLLTCGA
jgi:beta-N-acetylhexosaminidase